MTSILLASLLAGIPEDKIVGFRAPDLKYNNEMAAVLKERGFLYDSSIPIDTTSKAYYHPYTLDYGAIEQSWKAPAITTPHPGLWEFPLPTLVNDDFTTITIQDPSGSPEEIIELLEKNFGRRSIRTKIQICTMKGIEHRSSLDSPPLGCFRAKRNE